MIHNQGSHISTVFTKQFTRGCQKLTYNLMHSMCQRMLNSNSFENHMKAIHNKASLKHTVEKEKNI